VELSTHESLYKPSLYVSFLSFQYGTKVLKTPPQTPNVLVRTRHAVVSYHIALLGSSNTICNDPEKSLTTSMLSPQYE